MCDSAADMPEVVREGPIGVLDSDSGLSGLGDAACRPLRCRASLPSTASNCSHAHPNSATCTASLSMFSTGSGDTWQGAVNGTMHLPDFQVSGQSGLQEGCQKIVWPGQVLPKAPVGKQVGESTKKFTTPSCSRQHIP